MLFIGEQIINKVGRHPTLITMVADEAAYMHRTSYSQTYDAQRIRNSEPVKSRWKFVHIQSLVARLLLRPKALKPARL